MRKFGIVFGLLIAVLAISLGIALRSDLREHGQNLETNDSGQAADYAKALDLLKAGKPEEALEIVHKYKSEIESHSPNGMKWMELFVTASEEAKDVPQLIVLFEYFPEIFKEHENASLLVADSYITNNRVKDYKKIRSLWNDRETKVAAWFVLDVDQLLLEGRKEDAINLLKSRTFKDKADVGRLVRLALLYSDNDPKTAWRYLGEAYSKDPQNTDVRSYRGKLLESAGKYNMAHKEYLAAARINPKNIFLKDQLANFYLQQREYPLALKVWSENLAPPSLDNIWVKALFWNKVTTPLDFDWKDTPLPQGRLEPLIAYLSGLGENVFWDKDKFERVSNNKYFLKTQQETFWLRLLQALKNKDEREAYKLLQYNPFMATSWYPELESALKRVINYRMNGTLKLENPLSVKVDTIDEKKTHLELPPLLTKLEELGNGGNQQNAEAQIPQDLRRLLLSNEAFSAIFLAVGWYEAGLQLHELPVIPNDFPDWVAFNIVNAMHHNRSNLQALEFASLQKATPELSLLTSELMISGGDSAAALEKLNKLAKQDSDIGYRAAWLASLIYIDKKDWKNARNTILSQPRLVNDILGKETLARIAYLEGDTSLANKLYTQIEKISPEARSYLARKAYAEKDWKRAKELTEQLIKDYPDNPMLQENLKQIAEEQTKAESSKK